MAIIDPEGLLKGKRLRRCSAMARLYWPYLFLMSNGFARIELDFDSLSFAFASFGTAAPTDREIGGYFEEYEKNHLIFVYQADGQNWGQWDTRRSFLKDFKTAADKKSPNPPAPEYLSWLQKQHGDDWRAFHWNKDAGRDSGLTPTVEALVPQGLASTLANTAQDLPHFLLKVGRDLPLGIGGGVGVGAGDGIGEGGGNGERECHDNFLDGAPANAAPTDLVSGLLERLGIPSNLTIFRAVEESIRVKAKAEGMSATEAANSILLKAALAKKENPPASWLFWFRDARYDQQTKQERTDAFIRRHSEDAG